LTSEAAGQPACPLAHDTPLGARLCAPAVPRVEISLALENKLAG
jgi:hypothetical protein